MQSTRQQLDELDALLQRMLEMPVHQGEQGKTETVQDVLLRKLRSENSSMSGGAGPAMAPQHTGGPPRPANPYQVVESSDGAEGDYRSIRPGQSPNASGSAAGQGGAGSQRLSPGIDLPGSSKDGEWIPFRSSWQPSAQTWQPLANSWNQMASHGPAGESNRHLDRSGEQPSSRPNSAQAYSPGSEKGQSFPSFRPLPSISPDHSPSPAQQAHAPHPGRPSHAGVKAESGSSSLSVLPLVWFNWVFDLVVGSMGAPGQWLATASGKNFLGALGVLAFLVAGGIVFAQLTGWYP